MATMMQQELPQGAPPSMQPGMPPGPAGTPETPAPDKSRAEEVHKRLGLVAMKIIYDKATSASLIEHMRAGQENPPQAVAQAAMEVLSKMRRDVQGVNPDMAFAVSASVVVFLLELAVMAKLFPADLQMIKDSLSALAELTKQGGAPAPEATPEAAPPEAPTGAPQGGLINAAMGG